MNYLFWAYAAIWAGLAAFIALLFRRTLRLDRRLDRLDRDGD